MGGKTQNTTETKALPPWVDTAYQNLFNRANNVSQAKYKSFGRPRVAAWSPYSQQGLDMLPGLSGVGQGALNKSEALLDRIGGGPSITDRVSDVTSDYMNPYEDEVVRGVMDDSLRADGMAQNDLLGRAISSGANPFGGDRAGLAAASLAGDQSRARNNAAAGLRNTGYQTARDAALQAMMADQQGGLSAAGMYGDVSDSRFNQHSQTAKALLEGGTLEQQHRQNGIDAEYADFTEERDWEKNMTDWLSQIYGRGEYGGTTTKTEPGPSPLNAILGLAAGILPMFLDQKGKGQASNGGGGWGMPSKPIQGNWNARAGGFARGGTVEAERGPDDVWSIPAPREGERLVPPAPRDFRSRDGERPAAGLAPPAPRRPAGRPGARPGGVGAPAEDDRGRVASGLSGRMDRIANSPWRVGLMAGGFGMAASDSPFPLQAMGEGFSSGLAAALARRGDMDKAAAEEARFEREQARLDQQFEQNLTLQREQNAAQVGQWDTQNQLAQATLDANAVVLDDADTYRVFYPSTGKTVDTGIPIVRAAADSDVDTVTIYDEAEGREKVVIPRRDGTYVEVGGVKAADKPAPSETDKEIAGLVEGGLTLEDARKVARNQLRMSQNPNTGAVTLVDMTSGEERPVVWKGPPIASEMASEQPPPAGPAQGAKGAPARREGEIVVPAVTPPAADAPVGDADRSRAPLRTLWERAPNATGLANSLGRVATDILPQVLPGEQPPSGVIRPDIVEDQQSFSTATNDLIRSLSVNPRFPVSEMERIRQEIQIAPSALVGVEGLRARMRAVDTYLRNTLTNEVAAANNLQLPSEERQNARRSIKDIENFLKLMGVPQEGAEELEEVIPGIRRRRRAN